MSAMQAYTRYNANQRNPRKHWQMSLSCWAFLPPVVGASCIERAYLATQTDDGARIHSRWRRIGSTLTVGKLLPVFAGAVSGFRAEF